jgi:Asp/Glu/hydantoin racemase
MRFYSEAAPDFEITNLLDDGLLRLLSAGNHQTLRERLTDMLRVAAGTYGAELAMVTCSSIPKEMVAGLAPLNGRPVLKIDYPMAQQAVRAGQRIGVAATFAPTIVPTCKLISEAASEEGSTVEIIQEVTSEAYDALLSGDERRHDELLLAAVERLIERDVNVVVLAQISMARILPLLEGNTRVPVLSSLQTSLSAIRSALK